MQFYQPRELFLQPCTKLDKKRTEPDKNLHCEKRPVLQLLLVFHKKLDLSGFVVFVQNLLVLKSQKLSISYADSAILSLIIIGVTSKR